MLDHDQRTKINKRNAIHSAQNVKPLKNMNDIAKVKDTLLNNFPKYGRRNYTIFQVGKATLLRVSDVLSLKYSDVFDENGNIREHAFIHDQKTKKQNQLFLKPVETDLLAYQAWLRQHDYHSEWLFPNSRNANDHVQTKQFYHIMKKVGDLLGMDGLGTHTMRKTGAYLVYKQTGYNIALVMKLLNHSSAEMTLKYLGLDRETTDKALSGINFG